MKRIFTIIILIFSSLLSFGQKEGNVWMFGDSAGVDFNSTPPQPILNGKTKTGETSSSICDKNGNLLFYASSADPVYGYIFIWNKNNQVIQNGSGIFGCGTITQGTLLVPGPQNDSLVYLFHIYFDGLYFSEIDKNADGGNGSVILKNIFLLKSDSITEKLIAVRHANGRDWWIIAHRGGNNTFVKYILQKDIILGPYEQNIGSIHTTGLNLYPGSEGQMCISKNGNKLGCVTLNGLIDVFDFDRCNGNISNWEKLGDSITEFYGCCFSPDNSKFYITTGNENLEKYPKLYQYDLNAGNIIASRTLIFEQQNYLAYLGQMQLGIDNKIYLAKGVGWISSNVFDSINEYLGVINFPNKAGSLCEYNNFGIFLGGRRTYEGLPNIPNYKLGKIVESECDTIPEPNPPIDTLPVYYIPNIYSPNGDNQNDKFNVRGEKIKNLHLKIFNRWGNVVFETYDKSEGWDGYFKGSRCEEGVYVYRIEILFLDGKAISRNGNVTLIR